MKAKLFVLSLFLCPIVILAQDDKKHSDCIVLQKDLNDQYQLLHHNLTQSDGQVRKLQETREEIKRRYSNDHNAQDLDIIIGNLDQQERSIEANRKDWKERLVAVEEKIKVILIEAHGRTVEWRTYNANPVDKLGTVITSIYTLKDEQVVSTDIYDQLP